MKGVSEFKAELSITKFLSQGGLSIGSVGDIIQYGEPLDGVKWGMSFKRLMLTILK